MKVLICTQIVDEGDSNLGFFVRWIREFAKYADSVEVICLKRGPCTLPSNVHVHSLGKEHGAQSRLTYAVRFVRLAYRLRHEYDAVFVHMNPEYVVLAGPLWRAWGKRIALWYTHSSVTLGLRSAAIFAHIIFTASADSLQLRTYKKRVMGHGIDTEFFCPDPSIVRGSHILSVGRLMPSKHHDLVIQAAALAQKELLIIGDGPERAALEKVAHEVHATVRFLGGISQQQLRDEYRKAAYLIHASTTGSLDKVVLEALACDTAVISTAAHLYQELPLQSVSSPTPEAIANTLAGIRDSLDRVDLLRQKHSLQNLIPRIVEAMTGPRVALLSPVSRTDALRQIADGTGTDTVLLGANHLPQVEYLTIGEYPEHTRGVRLLRKLPRTLQGILMVPRLCRYHFVIAQDDLFIGFLVSLVARRTKWLYVAINTSILIRRHEHHPLRRLLLRLFWSSYARIICIATEQMADLRKLGVPGSGLRFIPYCVDTRFFKRDVGGREEPLVVSIGRDAGRDYPTLFRVAEGTPFSYVILAGHKNIPPGTPHPDSVTVLYNQGNQKARELYETAFAAAVVSKGSHIPDGSDCSGQTVILEALAAGKAVVATRRPWITDYLESGTDLEMVEAGDVNAIQAALKEYWDNPEKRHAFARAGQQKVLERYDTKVFAQELQKLMAEYERHA